MADKKISELINATSINSDAVFPLSQQVSGDETTVKGTIQQVASAVFSDIFTEVTGTLPAGSTSITLSDASITGSSTIDVYTDNDVDYNSVSVSTGSVTITFEAQISNLGVKVRVS